MTSILKIEVPVFIIVASILAFSWFIDWLAGASFAISGGSLFSYLILPLTVIVLAICLAVDSKKINWTEYDSVVPYKPLTLALMTLVIWKAVLGCYLYGRYKIAAGLVKAPATADEAVQPKTATRVLLTIACLLPYLFIAFLYLKFPTRIAGALGNTAVRSILEWYWTAGSIGYLMLLRRRSHLIPLTTALVVPIFLWIFFAPSLSARIATSAESISSAKNALLDIQEPLPAGWSYSAAGNEPLWLTLKNSSSGAWCRISEEHCIKHVDEKRFASMQSDYYDDSSTFGGEKFSCHSQKSTKKSGSEISGECLTPNNDIVRFEGWTPGNARSPVEAFPALKCIKSFKPLRKS